MPAGQLGAPVLMARHLAQRGMELHLAAAAITVSTTLQTFAQIAAASFSLTMLGWLAGTGQVYLILQLIHHPIGWTIALLLESLGQAIRGAAFAIPGPLGVQEGGYLLLAPLAGLPPDAARCRPMPRWRWPNAHASCCWVCPACCTCTFTRAAKLPPCKIPTVCPSKGF
jgi:hypothetical protein